MTITPGRKEYLSRYRETHVEYFHEKNLERSSKAAPKRKRAQKELLAQIETWFGHKWFKMKDFSKHLGKQVKGDKFHILIQIGKLESYRRGKGRTYYRVPEKKVRK